MLLRKRTFNSKANLESKIIFRYDQRHTNIETLTYHSDGSLASKTIQQFDSQNRLIESRQFDARDRIIGKKITRYDTAGYRILTTYAWIHQTLMKTCEAFFDRHENNVANFYFVDEELEYREINNYDPNGNMFESLQHYPATDHQVITRCTYDQRNNNVESIVSKNHLVTTKTVCGYDARNNLTNKSIYGVDGSLEAQHEFEYEYDEEGNWTKRVNIFNGRPTTVLRRRIEYY